MNAVRITLDALSGLENPVWDLDGAEADELRVRIKGLAACAGPPVPPPDLGYRGFVCELAGARVRVFRGLVERGPRDYAADPGRELELWLLGTAGARLSAGLYAVVRSDLAKN